MAVARACVQGGEDVLARARVEGLLRVHRTALLRLARRSGATAEDAEDALQRALEIYVRRLPTLDPATELAWLKVVLRHEALALASKRAASAALDDAELDGRLPADAAGVDERIESGERAEAGRAHGAAAQGAGLLLRGDRPAAELDLHEGQPGCYRGPAALHGRLPPDRDR